MLEAVDAVEEAETTLVTVLPVEVATTDEEAACAPFTPVADGETMGAVDWPAIWACTVELNVPVMPLIVNLAEKARAGIVGEVGSVAVSDWKRTKLFFGLEIWSNRNLLLGIRTIRRRWVR